MSLKRLGILLTNAVLALTAAGRIALAQSEPFVVYDAKPVILHGPYLVSPTSTSATVVWATDTPCHSKVIYGAGELKEEATSPRDGLLPVGTVHAIRLAGLRPGQTYNYKVVSTRVVRLKAYWPDKGLSVESAVHSFTTFDPNKPETSFSVISDTHEDVTRINALMKLIDWTSTDFLIHTGDAFNSVESEDQVFSKWLDPIAAALGSSKPLIYARGNHDTRGPFARNLHRYLPIEEGRFYYARDIGPVHLLAVDTGEDKPDNTNVYAHLNDFASYRQAEFAWLEEHSRTSKRMTDAPFRVVVMHQPRWGWSEAGEAPWTEWANSAKIDLVIAGHTHRFGHIKPGQRGNNYPILIVGQDEVCRVEASSRELKVSVIGKDGSIIDSFIVERFQSATN